MNIRHAIATWARAAMVAALTLAGPLAQAQGGAIVLGQSLALTGPGSVIAAPYHQGARLFLERLNATGGIQGRRIELLTLDDQGDPARTAAHTRKLMDQGVLALFGYVGSPQVTAAYPILKDSDLLLFAPLSAADEFRGALYPNVYALRPGYSEEAAAITRHAETLGARRLGILHAADGEALAALDAAERTMTGLGANLVARAPVAGGLDKLVAARPESVLVIAEPGAAAAAIKALRAKAFRGPIYGFSTTGESLLADLLGPAGAGVVVVRVVPRSDDARLPVVRALHESAGAAGLGRPNVYMLEGYLAARAMAEALRRAPQPTRAKLRKALESLDDMNLGGFRVHFAGARVGSRLVELSLIDSQGRVRE
ncbi:ABC transporter substrate-binding protein [Ramlibacter sp. MAHUQ-53]|uniref:ABC transporter substrate-binding protein n=1 Tax=unclassified Ramlibacter TaxID=2617605 RepID=UPI00362B416D